jgi:hypothetical protein
MLAGHQVVLGGDLRRVSGGGAWRVSGRGYTPPSGTPRGLFPNSLMSTGTEIGKGSKEETPAMKPVA